MEFSIDFYLIWFWLKRKNEKTFFSFISFCDQSANSYVNQSRFLHSFTIKHKHDFQKAIHELKQYLFKLKWVVIKYYYVMVSQIRQTEEKIMQSIKVIRLHISSSENHLEKKLILSFDPIFKLFRYFLSLFLFLDNLSHGMYNYFFYVFCADYWQTLSFGRLS